MSAFSNFEKLFKEFNDKFLIYDPENLKGKTIKSVFDSIMIFEDGYYAIIITNDDNINLEHNPCYNYHAYNQEYSFFWSVFKEFLKESHPDYFIKFNETFKKDQEEWLKVLNESNKNDIIRTLKRYQEKHPELEIKFKDDETR